jgi:hypothetical protein
MRIMRADCLVREAVQCWGCVPLAGKSLSILSISARQSR